MHQIEQYWIFAAICLVIAFGMFRLILRERVTLQGSLAFLVLLFLGTMVAVFPNATGWLTNHLGFQLPSNFFFAACIAALAVLHVSSLIALSRVELRTVALTQELAILQEKLDRVSAAAQPQPKLS